MPSSQIRKDLGYSTPTVRQKFALGTDPAEAKRREQRIRDLLESAEVQWRETHREVAQTRRFIWSDTPVAFEFAKQIAQGQTVFPLELYRVGINGTPVGPDGYFDNGYTSKLAMYQRLFPTLAFVPANSEAFAESKRFSDIALAFETEQLKKRGLVPQAQRSLIQAQGTLHQQIDRYIHEVIEKDYFDQTEGHVSDSGVYFRNCLKRIRHHTTDIELSHLDIAALNSIVGTFRNRPVSRKTGDPLDAKTCSKTIGEFKRFLRWLDMLSGTGWELPPKFVFIETRVKEVETDDVEAEGTETYTPQQLAILNQHATPIERFFMLLGLNCAYGADQAGRLRIREIHLEDAEPQIRRVRRKKGIKGCHLLWKPTIDAIKWALEKHPDGRPESYVLLNKSGKPYWRKTAGGNRAHDIPNLWRNLQKRVQKSHPDFPRYPFNTIRNTSADLVRQMSNEEMSLLQLTHKHQSRDENLRRYTNPKIQALFGVLAELEKKLAPVFAASEQPWVRPAKVYKPKSIDPQIVALHQEGLSPYKIGERLGISHMTVRRKLKRLKNAEL
jgi:hypothetical protein